MKTEMKKLYLLLMALLVSLTVWAVPDELYLYNTNPTRLGKFTKNGNLFSVVVYIPENAAISDKTIVLSEKSVASWEKINEKRWGASEENLEVSQGKHYVINEGWYNVWVLPAGIWNVKADFTVSSNPQLSIESVTPDWYFKWSGCDWQSMKMNVDGTWYIVCNKVKKWDNFYIAANKDDSNKYGQVNSNENWSMSTEYSPKLGADYGVVLGEDFDAKNVVIVWNPYTKILSAKEAVTPDYYFCGDLNQWQLATAGKHYRMDGTEMTAEDFKAAWRFVPCGDGDPYPPESGWYKLVVPVIGDGSHDQLCGQFKINDGRWNGDGYGYGHEWTVDFNHNEAAISLSNLKRMYEYIRNADDPITSAYKNEPYKRLRELGLTVRKHNDDGSVTEYTEAEITSADTAIFDEYLTLTRNIVSDNGLAAVSLANVCDPAVGSYSANINLPCNTVEPVGGNMNVVIYFNPGSIFSTDAVRKDAKIAIRGEKRDLYLYYCTDKPDNVENVVGVVRSSAESAAGVNYHVDRIPNMGNFEKVTDKTLIAPDGVEYTTFWRKKIANGYEHRMTGQSQTHEYFTVNFWRRLTGGDAEHISNDVIVCNDVYAIEGKTYGVQVSVRGSEQPVTGVGMYLCRTNANATKLVDATILDSEVELNDMTPVEMTAPDDANGWWTLPGGVMSRYGGSYLVFKVTFADNTSRLYNYAGDGSLQAEWYKMNHADKQVIINLGKDNLGIGNLYFSKLSGDCAANENLQVNVEITRDGRPFFELPVDENARDIKYAYGMGPDADVSNLQWLAEDVKVPYYTFTDLAAGNHYIFVRASYDADNAVEHIACAPFTVVETVTAPRLRVDGDGYYVVNNDANHVCESGVKAETVGDKNKVPQHVHVRVEGSLAESATVRWLKYDNGIRQEYKVTDKQGVTNTYDANALEKDYAAGCDFAHTTLNFGRCLYRVIVTAAEPAPAAAPRKTLLNRNTAVEQTNPADNAIAYSYYVTADNTTSVDSVLYDNDAAAEPMYYNLQGMPVDNPSAGNIYIEVRGAAARTIRY